MRFAFLPEGDDPDTYIRENGAAAFSGMLDRALPLIDFLWMHHIAGKTFATPESRAGLSAALDAISEKIPRAICNTITARCFVTSFAAFWGRVGRINAAHKIIKRTGSRRKWYPLPPISRKKADMLAPKVLLVTLLNHPQIYPYIVNECAKVMDDSEQGGLSELIRATVNILERHG